MSTPLTALARITINYTVLNLVHKHRMYVRLDPTGGTPVFVMDRDATPHISWIGAAQRVWDIVGGVLIGAGEPAPTAILEDYVAPYWRPHDFVTLSGVSGGGTASFPTSQATWVVRDTAFKFIRVIWLETLAGVLGHSSSGLGLSGPLTAVTNELAGPVVAHLSPWAWQVSRGNNYIAATGAIAGLTLDQNRKLKRVRHDE